MKPIIIKAMQFCSSFYEQSHFDIQRNVTINHPYAKIKAKSGLRMMHMCILIIFGVFPTSNDAQVFTGISINSDNPKGVLHVKQNIETGGCVECKELGFVLEDSDGDDRWEIFNSRSSGSILFWLFGANDGILTASASLNASGVWTDSDMAFKKNIHYLGAEPWMPTIMQLKPSHYQLRNSRSNTRSLGFIAQDIAKTLPDLVGTDEGGHLLLNYSYFSVMAIKGLQEVYSENQELRQEVDSLTQRNAELDRRLKNIESLLAGKL